MANRATIGGVSDEKVLSPIINHVPGAAAREDGTVAWHYGDPLGEQRKAIAASGVVDRSDRRVLRVSGADRLTWLNTLFSQKVDAAEPGTVTEALDLDGQGRVLHHMDMAVLEDSVLLVVAPEQQESLLKYLTMMVFWSDITIEETNLTVLSVIGDVQLPSGLTVLDHGVWRDVLVPRTDLVQVWDEIVAAGALPTGLMAWTAERVTALIPEPEDLDEKTIPHEVPRWIDTAVHLDKGCYRGQETVARVQNLGRPPRTLVMLQLDGSAAALPETGDAVTAGRRTVGRVGTVVDHCDYGPIALALVKRSSQEGVELTVGDCAVSVDPGSVDRDDSVRPGRAAVDRLRGRVD